MGFPSKLKCLSYLFFEIVLLNYFKNSGHNLLFSNSIFSMELLNSRDSTKHCKSLLIKSFLFILKVSKLSFPFNDLNKSLN